MWHYNFVQINFRTIEQDTKTYATYYATEDNKISFFSVFQYRQQI